jgi:tartrate-resistant acid phosphatase type 5
MPADILIRTLGRDRTSRANGLFEEHYFDEPRHQQSLRRTLFDGVAGRWHVPFSRHPPYCAGPSHPNSQGMIDRLCPLLRGAGSG